MDRLNRDQEQQGTGDRGQGTAGGVAGGPLFSYPTPRFVILRAGHIVVAACTRNGRPEGSCRGCTVARARQRHASLGGPSPRSFLASLSHKQRGRGEPVGNHQARRRLWHYSDARFARWRRCMSGVAEAVPWCRGGLQDRSMYPRRHPRHRADRAPPLPGSFGRGGWGERASRGNAQTPATHSALGTIRTRHYALLASATPHATAANRVPAKRSRRERSATARAAGSPEAATVSVPRTR